MGRASSCLVGDLSNAAVEGKRKVMGEAGEETGTLWHTAGGHCSVGVQVKQPLKSGVLDS